MNKATKYSLFSGALVIAGLTIVSLSLKSWIPIGVGIIILGIIGLIAAPLLAIYD